MTPYQQFHNFQGSQQGMQHQHLLPSRQDGHRCDRQWFPFNALWVGLAGTVIALTISTPLLVIFSPVLVPTVIAFSLIIMGFLTSSGFGVASVTVVTWIYRYATGKQPPGADQLDSARHKLARKASEMKDRAEQFIDPVVDESL
ncbi:hypothetical protein ACFX1T_045527 [Malus domestica]